MKKMKKFAILFTSTALTLGITSSIGHAQSPMEGQNDRVAIEVNNSDKVLSKTAFIKKLKELFPNQFNFLAESDFQLSNAHHYPDDERTRYDLSFQKMISGKDVYGSVTFVGDELEIESFYYTPVTTSDALFPAKVSKETAEKIGTEFLGKLPNGKNYELDPSNTNYNYYSNQPLTEPIRYDFSYVLKENNIPIADQYIYISVLGSGEITQFYRYTLNSTKATYDDVK
ncbi:MAG TPA: hypothetical protein VNR38_05215, partial [Ureibacillus sp.]|nr:hypothetical protein [Ureibacillus sp.]